MNREIRFRAWDKALQKWYYDNDHLFVCHDKIFFKELGNENYKVSKANCDFCQSTGLKDINNVEIYEGDIVRCIDQDPPLPRFLNISRKGKPREGVVFYNPSFGQWLVSRGRSSEINHYLIFLATEIEIIGNIIVSPNFFSDGK